MNYRTSAFFACLAVAGLALAENYEVTVPLGETNRIDAAFVSALGSKDLVKKGRGVLWSSSAMANYAGKITVEEGALMVSGSSDLGTTAGSTEVKPGATLIIYTDAGVEGSAGNDGLAFSEGFTVGGTGDAQWGAAIYQPPVGYSQQKAFGNSVSLTEDTTFSMGVRAGFTGGELYMRGYTLTLNGGVFNFQRSRMTPRETSDVGDIVVERGTFQIGGNVSGQFGDPAHTVTVKDGASLSFYEADQVPVWKLLVEEGGKVAVNGSSAAKAKAVWGGDVEWNSTADDTSVISRADGGTLTFQGAVTGTGTMRSNGGAIVFEKSCADTLGMDMANAHVVLPSVDRYWGHGGMMVGKREGTGVANFDDPAKATWEYCAEGPGPQLHTSYWTKGTDQMRCSRGYIWNREATNVTFKISVRSTYKTYVYKGFTSSGSIGASQWNSPTILSLSVPAGQCQAIDIRTEAYKSNYGGPSGNAAKGDNDTYRIKVNDVNAIDPGNGYLFTTDTVARAEVILENTYKKANYAFGDNSVLDANGMPIELTGLSGFVTVTNAMTCKVKGTWSLKAADFGQNPLTVTGDAPLTFENVTIAVDDVDSIPRTQKHWDICVADSITGFPADTILSGAKRKWKLVLSADGKSAGLEYQPKGMAAILR